jgi:polar amino acid transport system permease protein/polar amino acid transport system substrate-binding protein
VIPQAARIVVPPVTNDFINMFKDTSICSVITVMELTKQYTVQQNNTGATLELAAMTALLYLAMSIPLARLASHLEKRLNRRPTGVA